jgi:formate dehydrogenase major subunit
VADPRRIDLVVARMSRPHHLQLKPGTNVAVITALAHVVVTEGLLARTTLPSAATTSPSSEWRDFVARPENSPEAMEAVTGVPAAELRGAARLYATGGNAAIYYGLGVTEHARARPW